MVMAETSMLMSSWNGARPLVTAIMLPRVGDPEKATAGTTVGARRSAHIHPHLRARLLATLTSAKVSLTMMYRPCYTVAPRAQSLQKEEVLKHALPDSLL